MEDYVEVSENDFFAAITDKNCRPQIVGEYPYTSLFKMQDYSQKIVGKIENGDSNKKSRYYLPKNA